MAQRESDPERRRKTPVFTVEDNQAYDSDPDEGQKAPKRVQSVRFSDHIEDEEPPLERVKKPFKTFEEALSRVGMFGRYQIFTCMVVQYASIMWAGNYSFMSLGTIEPDWICDDESWNHTRHYAPTHSNAGFCEMISNCTNLTTVHDVFASIVEEWRLVCDKKYVPDLLLILYALGRIGGSILGGHIGDHFGRKRGFFSAQFVIMITSVMSICSKKWTDFAIFQSLNGFFFGIIEV